jgi:hypothetical protein
MILSQNRDGGSVSILSASLYLDSYEVTKIYAKLLIWIPRIHSTVYFTSSTHYPKETEEKETAVLQRGI